MWKNIWNSKGKTQNLGNFSIADLMKFDGFDTGNALSFNEQAWLKYALDIAQTCAIANGEKRILEIGCGSGGFLKALNNINNALKINGIDYSKSLLKIAQSVMPDGVFVYDEAKNLNTAPQFGGGGGGRFDLIFSNSVFHYFPSQAYVFDVIQKAYQLLNIGGGLAFLDLNDVAQKEIYGKLRRGHLSEEEYQQKYAGLEHLFFNRREVFDFVRRLGFEKIIVEDQHIEGYVNNSCRFNIFALGKKKRKINFSTVNVKKF